MAIIDERTFREYIELIKFTNAVPVLSNYKNGFEELGISELDAVYAAQGTNDFTAMLETFNKKMYSK